MSNKLVKGNGSNKQRYVGDSVNVIESESDKEDKRWRAARVYAFTIAVLTIGSTIFTIDGTVYTLCQKVSTYTGVEAVYFAAGVAILQVVIMVAAVIRLWYVHMQCVKRGLN